MSGAATAASLELTADLADLRGLGPWLAEFLERAGAADLHGPLELAVHEICVNVVTHGYAGGPGTLGLEARADAEAVEVRVLDQGPAVDPDAVPEPVPGVPQIHGYGLMIVRRLVDELTYIHAEGTNTWLLRKAR